MTTIQERVSKLEGAYEQMVKRIRDLHTEMLAIRSEMRALRSEMYSATRRTSR